MTKVYLISATINDNILYKIGYTKRDVETRINELKTGNPAIFEIIDVYESKWARRIESTLHNKYNHLKVNGEWFSLEDIDVTNFKTNCEQININLNLIEENNTYYQDKNKFF